MREAGALTAALPATSAEAGVQRTVPYEYVRQQTQSWCSAASSFIALSSRRNPTQAGLARRLGLEGGSGLQDPLRIAAVLNARGVRTARGGRWAATQVGAVLARVGCEAGSAGPLVCKAGVVEWEGG